MSEDNEVYRLAPNGVLGEALTDKLMLYMYKIGCNGIVLDEGSLHFVSLEKGENNE